MEIDVKQLLALIQARSIIYDYKHKDHSNRTKIDYLWHEIAYELNCEVPYCKSKWTSLRNSYSRYLRDERNSSIGKRKKKWYLADSMSFLKDYIRLIAKDESVNEKFSPYIDCDNKSMQSLDSNDEPPVKKERISQKKNSTELDFNFSSHFSDDSDYSFETDDPLMGQDIIVENKPCIDTLDNTTSEIPLLQDKTDVFPEISVTQESSNRKDTNIGSKSLKFDNRNETNSESAIVCEDDADMFFLKSIYKDLSKLSNSRKRKFKVEMITALYKHLDEEEQH